MNEYVERGLQAVEKHTPEVSLVALSAIAGFSLGLFVDWSWDGAVDQDPLHPNLLTVALAVSGAALGTRYILKNTK